MSRWTGSWLSGPRSVLPESDSAQQRYRGEWRGLPESGPGSVAGFPSRFVALVVDWLPCTVVAQTLTQNPAWSTLALFALLTWLSMWWFGATPGHALVGIRPRLLPDAGRVESAGMLSRRPGFGACVVRAVLLSVLIPPLIWDRDGRGLHDRATNTIVLRTR